MNHSINTIVILPFFAIVQKYNKTSTKKIKKLMKKTLKKQIEKKIC